MTKEEVDEARMKGTPLVWEFQETDLDGDHYPVEAWVVVLLEHPRASAPTGHVPVAWNRDTAWGYVPWQELRLATAEEVLTGEGKR